MGVLDMEDLIDSARAAVVGKAEEAARGGNPVKAVVLDLPCTFFMLRSLRCAASHPHSTVHSMHGCQLLVQGR